ncbi:hypothetical protein [Mycobacterium parmense]|uniref:Uncharacterized protein n=1 Tax=Mycobacterium parmense TaxID=185642 RepID=A0A7I7YT73_9MYCO|nr:hypothetical protein [Mycobacterium parmense]MCV7348821.1 hypothetical protein [Mycobacterium parmense]ORW49681.1 hypothetical protein AWC20_03605 [Mycobacterium parmense]BBZ44334.1 hypothetical protein MPRM_16150 [Mycobacterium parmense]
MPTPNPTGWLNKLDRSDLADMLYDPEPAVELLRGLRAVLTTWWNELSEDVQDGLRDNKAGIVSGAYREDVAALGPLGEIDSWGRDLRSDFRLPLVVWAFLDFMNSEQRK